MPRVVHKFASAQKSNFQAQNRTAKIQKVNIRRRVSPSPSQSQRCPEALIRGINSIPTAAVLSLKPAAAATVQSPHEVHFTARPVIQWSMKFSGTPDRLFQAVQEGAQRFQCIGHAGLPRLAGLAAGAAVVGSGVALSIKAAEQRQRKEIKRLVRREVRKTIKPRQPNGISFDLFS